MYKYKETFETWNNLASTYQDKFMDRDNETYDFKSNPNGRVLFYFHELEWLKSKLILNNFEKIELFKININDKDIHTILIAKRK